MVTAAVLIPVVLGAVMALSRGAFALLMALFALLGAWEWAGLAGWSRRLARSLYVAVFAGLLGLVYARIEQEGFALSVLVAGLGWWIVALAWVVRYQQGLGCDALRAFVARLVVGWLLLLPAWTGLVFLHGQGTAGRLLVLAVLVLTWVADSGAYFAGRMLGVRRLAVNVSPGKTLEGVCGGLAAVAIVALGAAWVAGLAVVPLLGFVALCVATAVVSVLGDLTESLFKRRAGIKDSGQLVPGHGGVLDRIDSLTAAAPFFVLGAHWLVRLA